MIQHLRLITDNARAALTPEQIEEVRAVVASGELPAFQQHNFNVGELVTMLDPYQKYEHIIILANGGSRTSALAYWQSLKHIRNNKTVEFVATMEPDVIADIRHRYSPQDTLVMPISKSGTNVDVLEPLLQLLDYPVLAVTSPQKGLLYDMAKHYEWDIVPHPEVGGRYSGRTECGLAPAILMGLDAEKIYNAAVSAYESLDYNALNENNIALQAAAICAAHEQKGITEIFMPIYSVALSGWIPLTVQLLHESTGKDGKGQTIFGDQAPESQHHTNQRYFGGRRDVMGFFMTVAQQHNNDMTLRIPEEIRDLPLREGTLADLDGIPLQDALRFDYEGVAENSTRLEIPHMTLEVDAITEESMGEVLSFLHYYTVYSSLLRNQDPFDQPQVEDAKNVSFQKRRAFQS